MLNKKKNKYADPNKTKQNKQFFNCLLRKKRLNFAK